MERSALFRDVLCDNEFYTLAVFIASDGHLSSRFLSALCSKPAATDNYIFGICLFILPLDAAFLWDGNTNLFLLRSDITTFMN